MFSVVIIFFAAVVFSRPTTLTGLEPSSALAQYLKQQGINDVRKIDKTTVINFAEQLRQWVNSGDVRVAYAQNILSTVNVV